MSTRHISDDLPRLLTGDATRDVVLEAAAHLRTCADCQQELVSAVVAHASLSSAHRFAPEIVSTTDRESRENAADDAADDPANLPDLSAVFAEARAEASAPDARRHVPRRRLALVAAAAAVVVGGGIAGGLVATSGDSGPATHTVALDAFGVGKHDATATFVGSDKLKVNAAALPKLGHDRVYEVWLTNTDRTHMQSVGYIRDDNTAQLPVSSKVLNQYNAIEVSVQKANQNRYSNVSVLRGNYG